MGIKHLFKAVFILTVFSVLTRAFGFLFRIYLSREMGAEILGVYSIALSIFGIMQTAVSSGIPLTISKKTSENVALGKNNGGKYVTSGTITSLVISLVVFAGLFAFKPIIIKMAYGNTIFNILLVLMPALIFDGIYSSLRGNMWGRKRFFHVSITEFIEQILRIIVCVILFIMPSLSGLKAESAAVSYSIAVVLSSIIALVFYLCDKQKLNSPKGAFIDLTKSSTPITLVRIAGSLAAPLISLILPFRLVSAGLTEAQAVAELGIVSGMVLPLLSVPGTFTGSIATALVPDLSALNVKKQYDSMHDQIKSTFIATLVISFTFVPLFISAGREIGLVLYKNLDAGKLIAKSAIIMVPMGLANMSSAILNSLGLEVKSMRNYLLGSIFLFASLWFLPSVIGGGMSLIVGMGLFSIISFMLNLVMIKKHVHNKINILKPILTLLIFSLITGFIGKFTTNLLVLKLGDFLSAIIGGGLSLCLFAILLQAFKYIDFFKIIKKFKHSMVKTFNKRSKKYVR